MYHTLVYFLVFMSNMTDYIFIQYQILNILKLFVNLNSFSSIFVVCFICISFHGTMLVNSNLRFLINKVFSWIVFICTISMVIYSFFDSASYKKIELGYQKSMADESFFSYDRGKVLQSLVILVAAFRSNDEILTIFEQTGKKKTSEMQTYQTWTAGVFTLICMVFGVTFYWRNYDEFRSTSINLRNGYYGFYGNSLILNCVRNQTVF